MPIINRQDAAEVEHYIARFFAASSAERVQALRRLFVEKLDFAGASGAVSLANAPKTVALPPQAERIASMEGLHVVYVPLSGNGPDRVRKAEATAAAKLIADALHGDLLLVMTNPSGSQLHVICPSFVGATPSLRRMIIERDLPRRTAVQQFSNVFWQWKDTGSIRMAVDKAFDVEAVTKQFFEEYKRVFERTLDTVKGFGPSKEEEEAKKLFVQTMFNRLMFIYFISRKGWLAFDRDKDYLNALWRAHKARPDENKNFYVDRLRLLFFAALNNPNSQDLTSEPESHRLLGIVPFLNGGLFDRTDGDNRTRVLVPDDCIQEILSELFDRFNFTVMESTPFDVEVAVDPEMLGKVFEELVTGRHESGSYYTPRPVVSFMCREALKGYLETQNTGASPEAIAAFVDHKDTSNLTLSLAPKIGEALARVTVVDPACGSGAYLLGMMQELVELMTTLYSAQLSHQAQDLYNLKLGIIQQNLYGADKDLFAVNIAMLRLWLSLAIEYDGPVEKLPPLPNLDFKIVCGDSLLGPDPSPQNYGTLFRHRVHQLAGQLADLKDRHMGATGQPKANLTKDIEGLKAQLREALAESAVAEDAVDWRVEFAEVFDQNGGFDVAIANPPYVRQEDIVPNKDKLRKLYAQAVTGKSDLYCYFYARALELLRKGGMHVFVCSNSWLDVGYGAKLQEYLLKSAWVRAIYDSAVERQFSTAAINTIIGVCQKGVPAPDILTRFVSLRDAFDIALTDPGKQRVTTKTREELWRAGLEEEGDKKASFVGDKWGGKYLRAPEIFHRLIDVHEKKLIPLKSVAIIRFGIKTGANEFFYLDAGRIKTLGLEIEYCKPVVRSPKEIKGVLIQPETPQLRLFLCHKSKAELRGTAALEYVQWGESQDFHKRPSCSGRPRWWDLGPKELPRIGVNYLVGTTAKAFYAPRGMSFSDNFHEIFEYGVSPGPLAISLNSSICQLMLNVAGRSNFGGGLLKIQRFELAGIFIPDPKLLPTTNTKVLATSEWDVLEPGQGRQELDALVFDCLGIDRAEGMTIQEELSDLVRKRLEKAASL